MSCFRKYIFLPVVLSILASCKNKKPSLSGEDPVEIGDFIEFFPEKDLPYLITDTSLLKKDKDSLLINYKIFTQFIPDSLLSKVFGKSANLKIYPLGKISAEEDTYLFAKAISGNKRAAFIFSFDKEDQYMDGMPLLQLDQYQSTQQSGSIDKSYSINKIITRKNPDGSLSEGKDVYGLNKEGKKFALIMTDPLDDKVTELINPIDTFSRKHKYAADYGTGKMNLVSIRDGRKNDRLHFFIHFDKNNGGCTGELKGEALIKSSTVAEYREAGNPCALRFSFTSSSVIVKELEGCGSYRGLRCSFDGTFSKKKVVKPKSAKKSSNKK